MKTSPVRTVLTALFKTLVVVFLVAFIPFTPSPVGQTAGVPTERPTLPARADQWINSAPLTYESLHGKGAFLYYFEETCPKVMSQWPAMKKLAADNADNPVMFIGVNSGTSRSDLQ